MQYRLGGFAKKTGGPNLYLVIKVKKGIRLTPAHAPSDNGRSIHKKDEKFITVFDTKYREVE